MDRHSTHRTDKQNKDRQAVIAQAAPAALKIAWEALGLDPDFTMVRGPDTGLVALRGRIGGGGAPFPFGDATSTRTTVRLGDGRIGHAFLLGRDHARATIAAVVDALCQHNEDAQRIDEELIRPLSAEVNARDRKRQAETAATRVDFFTMVRGED